MFVVEHPKTVSQKTVRSIVQVMMEAQGRNYLEMLYTPLCCYFIEKGCPYYQINWYCIKKKIVLPASWIFWDQKPSIWLPWPYVTSYFGKYFCFCCASRRCTSYYDLRRTNSLCFQVFVKEFMSVKEQVKSTMGADLFQQFMVRETCIVCITACDYLYFIRIS